MTAKTGKISVINDSPLYVMMLADCLAESRLEALKLTKEKGILLASFSKNTQENVIDSWYETEVIEEATSM